jgi:hypothetical protein
MLIRGCNQQSQDFMDEDDTSGDNDEKDAQEHNHKEAVQLTKNMNAATANNLLSLDKDKNKNNKEEFDSAIGSEDTINFYSDDKGGKDFLEGDLNNQQEDLTLGKDFDTASEVVSSGDLTRLTPTSLKSPTTSRSFYET